MYEGIFPEYIEMVNPPVKVSEYVKSFSCIYGPHLVFRASIRVSFLLVVCQNPVKNLAHSSLVGPCIFQHNADRERAATGWKGLTIATSKDGGVVPRHDSNNVIRTLVTAWKRKNTLLPLSRGKPFCFYACVIPFSCYGSLGVFYEFNSFLFIYLFIYFLI